MHYRAVLEAAPANFDALQLLGALRLEQGDPVAAEALLRRAIAVRPTEARVFFNLGCALDRQGRYQEAISAFDVALRLRPEHAQTLAGRGSARVGLRDCAAAIVDYDASLKLRPNDAGTHANRGAALFELGACEAAIEAWRRAIALDPGRADLWGRIGVAYDRLGRLEEAGEAYRAVGADKSPHVALWGHFQQRICDWTDVDSFIPALQVRAAQPNPSTDPLETTSPFVVLGSIDDPALQLVAARRYAESFVGAPAEPVWRGERYEHDGIRVAYLSADFHEHATAALMVDLFEAHDRRRVRTLGVSWGPTDGSALQKRVRASVDDFIDVRVRSDREVAMLLRERAIDIVVDLKGYTGESRPRIFAERGAPVQVSYLAYPGSMGVPYIDYLVADPFIVPDAERAHYSESLVWLPHCYQPNDRQLHIAPAPSRAALGLPAEGFVFACFNNSWKITPAVFEVWMGLLAAVPGSVLWLLGPNALAVRNLRAAAAARGVDPDRLCFAARVGRAEHLARQRAADLSLDTLPCNAHTTASDALAAGLIHLTIAGRSFPARVAGSLLTAVGLPELVTYDLEAYRRLALELALDPQRLAALRVRLEAGRATAPLYDTPRLARHLEWAYAVMVARARAGEPPSDLRVPVDPAPFTVGDL